MIGLDTNLLVRYLTLDDAAQSKQAARIIDAAIEAGEDLYLNHIVVCELTWVLSRAYGYAKDELVGVLERILAAGQFAFEDKDSLWRAIEAFRRSSADFADCLIGVKNSTAGCRTTVTLDRAAAGLGNFSLP
jgi:predicted nucleic-acid-binding protein